MIKIEKYPFVKGDRGVYRIVFNDTWFYIGSAIDLYARQASWLIVFRSAYWINTTSKIKKIRPLVTNIRFEYIEKTTKEVNEKDIETQHIQHYLGDEFILNKVTTARKAILKPFKAKKQVCRQIPFLLKSGLFSQYKTTLTINPTDN
jgi:hypothetical protein